MSEQPGPPEQPWGPPGQQWGPPGQPWGPPGQPWGRAPSSALGGPPDNDERTWALLCHLSYFVFGLIGPLVVMLTRGRDSPYVRDQAVEALNFHLTLLIAAVVSAVLVLVLIGILLLLVVVVWGAVLAVVAAVAASRGERYRYPLVLRMVR